MPVSETPGWKPAKRRTIDGIVAALIANSIDALNSAHPDRWGLTKHPGGVYRLNAGYCEALTVFPGEVALLVVEDTAIRALKSSKLEIQRRRGAFYKVVPRSVRLVIDDTSASGLESIFRRCWPAHFSFLKRASNWALGGGVRSAHSNEAVGEVAREAGRRLLCPPWAGAVEDSRTFWEGAERRSQQTSYERNRSAREACIAKHGTSCGVCRLSFEARYGVLGAGYIEVHHLTPLGASRGLRPVDPAADMLPVCANCHRMLHTSHPPLSPDELRRRLKGRKG